MSTQSERFNCMKSQRDEARSRIKELENELSDVQPILGKEQQAEIRRVTDENSALRTRITQLEASLVFEIDDGMAVVCSDDEAAIDGAIELLKSQAAIIANFKGHLGVDQKPDEYALVEVYNQSMFSGMRPANWTGWLADSVKDWHLWRPSFAPDDSVLARSEEIRRQLGVVELEGNGLYRLPEKDDAP